MFKFKKIFFVLVLLAATFFVAGAVRAADSIKRDDFYRYISGMSLEDLGLAERQLINNYNNFVDDKENINVDHFIDYLDTITFEDFDIGTDGFVDIDISKIKKTVSSYQDYLENPNTPAATPPSQATPAGQTPTTPATQSTVDPANPTANPIGGTEFQNQQAKAGVPLDDPLDLGDNPIPTLISRLVTFVVGLVGILALLAFVYGGLLYMTFGYDPKNVEKGKTIMKSAVIGLFITFSSYFVVSFVITELTALQTKTSVVEVVPPLINLALGVSGVLLLFAFIYGGVLYLLAGLDPKNVEKAKNIMKYAVMGLAIIFASYAIVNFLLTNVLNF